MEKEKPNIKNSPLLKRIIKEGESIPKNIMKRMVEGGDPQDVERFAAISRVRNARKKEQEGKK